MIRLQIQLFAPYFNSFSTHSYNYDASNELKSVLKHSNFGSARIVRQTPREGDSQHADF